MSSGDRSRRDFLKTVGAAAATGALLGPRAARGGKAAALVPAVIATWNHGLLACTEAQRVLLAGGDLLDALERGVNLVEDDPKCTSVGYGGLPNEEGVVQLDAAIMDGRTHGSGAVAGLERIKNPISVARKVMERTRHALLVGDGARRFARRMGFVEQELTTPESLARWQQLKDDFWVGGRESAGGTRAGAVPVSTPPGHDTVCVLAVDARGDLASAVSTSGLEWKIAGRVGDSPILGAGSYVDNEVGAAAATGVGELTLRTLASFAIVERMRAGSDPEQACREVMARVIAKIPAVKSDPRMGLAFIALDKRGRGGAISLRAGGDPFRFAYAGGQAAPAMHDAKAVLPK